MKDLLKQLNQRPIAYYPIYRKIAGSTTAGVLLSQLMYWLSKSDKIHKTDAKIMEETLLSADELRAAKKKIKALDFINVTREGIPAKTYYEIDWNGLENALTSFGESHKPVSGNSPNCDRENPETNNIETTAETTAESYRAREDAPKKTDGNFSFNLNRKQPYSKLSEEYKKRLFGYAITKDGADQFQAFTDFHTAKGTSFKDWASAYRTWLRNVTKFGGELSSPTEAVGQGGEPLYLDFTGQWVVRYGDESYTPLQVTGRRTVQSEEPEEVKPPSEPTPGQRQFMESLKEAAERMRA